jgi:hypothetical protein
LEYLGVYWGIIEMDLEEAVFEDVETVYLGQVRVQ